MGKFIYMNMGILPMAIALIKTSFLFPATINYLILSRTGKVLWIMPHFIIEYLCYQSNSGLMWVINAAVSSLAFYISFLTTLWEFYKYQVKSVFSFLNEKKKKKTRKPKNVTLMTEKFPTHPIYLPKRRMGKKSLGLS